MSRHVVLGVAGGIAAYKAAALCSALVQRGDTVDVVMTAGAERFVAPLTFAALTRRPVAASLWDAPETIAHIALARAADVLVVAPATASTIARIALGISDDLLANVALATRAPIVVAPAMNSAMYDHPATRGHLATLRARGFTIVEPGVGFLAEREHGVGRLAEQDAIVAAIDRACARSHDLDGTHVLVTAGPTREAIDPVRFLSNAATGTMGIALAAEALARGASVDLVLGPTDVPPPPGARTVRVVTAREMRDAVMARAANAQIAIAAAAVADWAPRETSAHKRKKHDGAESLELERTPDILAELGACENGTYLVGFAAETDDLEANGREKLVRKRLDAIAVNDVSSPASGFGTGENEIVVLHRGGARDELGRASKPELARRMWDVLLRERAANAPPAPTR